MTKADARVLLRDCGGFGGLETWMAEQPRQAAPGGWIVTSELQGWSFQLEPVAGGLHIAAGVPSGAPAVWVIAPRAT